MRVLAATYRLQLVSLLRVPVPIIGQLLLPTVFFALFGLTAPPSQRLSLAIGFACFSVLSVVLTDFGLSIAAERDQPWAAFDRTLPGSASGRLLGRILSSLTYGSLGALPLLAVAAWNHEGAVVLPIAGTLAALVLGGIQFGAVGFLIGRLVHERSAAMLGGIASLVLSFLGGFFTTFDRLPSAVQVVSAWTPSRWYLELAQASFGLNTRPLWALGLINLAFTLTMVFAALSLESRWKLRDYS